MKNIVMLHRIQKLFHKSVRREIGRESHSARIEGE